MADSTTAKPVKFKTILYLRLAAAHRFAGNILLAKNAAGINGIAAIQAGQADLEQFYPIAINLGHDRPLAGRHLPQMLAGHPQDFLGGGFGFVGTELDSPGI